MIMIMNCFCGMNDQWKAFMPYFQPGPLSEILTIANLWHAARSVWTWAKSKFRLCWMKLCSSDNHYTMAPLKQIKETWKNKPLHDQYQQQSQQTDIDQTNTNQWLRSVGMGAEIEEFIMVAQDQSLYTRNYQARIIKNGLDPKCRMCD